MVIKAANQYIGGGLEDRQFLYLQLQGHTKYSKKLTGKGELMSMIDYMNPEKERKKSYVLILYGCPMPWHD